MLLVFYPYLGDKGFNCFPKGISPKAKVIERVEYEFTYEVKTVLQDSKNSIRITPSKVVNPNKNCPDIPRTLTIPRLGIINLKRVS